MILFYTEAGERGNNVNLLLTCSSAASTYFIMHSYDAAAAAAAYMIFVYMRICAHNKHNDRMMK